MESLLKCVFWDVWTKNGQSNRCWEEEHAKFFEIARKIDN